MFSSNPTELALLFEKTFYVIVLNMNIQGRGWETRSNTESNLSLSIRKKDIEDFRIFNKNGGQEKTDSLIPTEFLSRTPVPKLLLYSIH